MKQTTYSWPMTTAELAEVLDIKVSTVRRHQSLRGKSLNFGEGKDYWDHAVAYTNAKDPKNIVWSEQGAIKIAWHCRSRKAGVFLENVGAVKRHRSSVESASLDIVKAALKGITKCQRQFPVDRWGKYKIDLYLPDLKIAVECDEAGHEGRDIWDEDFRQKEIEAKLQCRFIRFNPDEANFNIGNVINELLSAIIGPELSRLSI